MKYKYKYIVMCALCYLLAGLAGSQSYLSAATSNDSMLLPYSEPVDPPVEGVDPPVEPPVEEITPPVEPPVEEITPPVDPVEPEVPTEPENPTVAEGVDEEETVVSTKTTLANTGEKTNIILLLGTVIMFLGCSVILFLKRKMVKTSER